jgi:hypothetical protein
MASSSSLTPSEEYGISIRKFSQNVDVYWGDGKIYEQLYQLISETPLEDDTSNDELVEAIFGNFFQYVIVAHVDCGYTVCYIAMLFAFALNNNCWLAASLLAIRGHPKEFDRFYARYRSLLITKWPALRVRVNTDPIESVVWGHVPPSDQLVVADLERPVDMLDLLHAYKGQGEFDSVCLRQRADVKGVTDQHNVHLYLLVSVLERNLIGIVYFQDAIVKLFPQCTCWLGGRTFLDEEYFPQLYRVTQELLLLAAKNSFLSFEIAELKKNAETRNPWWLFSSRETWYSGKTTTRS